MVYPEEPFWALPMVSGLYEDRDYRGKSNYFDEYDLILYFICIVIYS